VRPLGEITLFTRGDSRRVTTWSGLPKGCADALEELGIVVHRVDTMPLRKVLRAVDRLRQRIGIRDDLLYQVIYSRLERQQVAGACRRYPSSQCNLFLTYSFTSHGLSHLPVVHYCDECFAQVVDSRGGDLSRGEKRRLTEEEEALGTSDLILSTNRHGVEFLKSYYGFGNVFSEAVGGITQTKCGGEALSGGPLRTRTRSVLFVGSSVEERGLDVLLEALVIFNRTAETGYKLDVIGFEAGAVPGDWPDTTWHGRLDRSRPDEAQLFSRLMEQATMFVLPSRSGPPARAMVEAQLAGTPVIVTNVWGTDEYVQDGRTGLMLDAPTPEAVCEAMRRIDADPALWQEISSAGHESAMRFSWQRAAVTIAEQIEHAIQRANASKRQRRAVGG
jgi:glycosyltransferase involved in cell wall biosynthesis